MANHSLRPTAGVSRQRSPELDRREIILYGCSTSNPTHISRPAIWGVSRRGNEDVGNSWRVAAVYAVKL